MTEQELTLDEYLVVIRPEMERNVDTMILEAEPADRPLLIAHREQIVREVMHMTEVANLRHRIAQAEARLRPHLAD